MKCGELETRLRESDATLTQLSHDMELKVERIRQLEERLVDSNSSQQNHLEQLLSLEERIRDGRNHLDEVFIHIISCLDLGLSLLILFCLICEG